MKNYLLILGLVVSFFGFSQTPKVPAIMYFGDIQLKINAVGQKKIQSHVDSYRRSNKYRECKKYRKLRIR